MSVHAEAEPRWRRRPAERPEEILEAALEVFADQGLAGARVEDIAARAGVSKGTLYHYFPSKDELFQEAVRSRVEKIVANLAVAAAPGEPAERLDRFIAAWWGLLRQPLFGKLYRLVLAELHQFPELVRFYADEISGQVSAVAADIIRQGVEKRVFRPVDPTVTAMMIGALLTQHAVWSGQRQLFSSLRGRTEDELVRDVRDFVFAAILRDGSRGGES
jgi:AcrR family transcriptional regulator